MMKVFDISSDSRQSRLRTDLISFVARHDNPEDLIEHLGSLCTSAYACEYAGYQRPGKNRVSWCRIADFCARCPVKERCPFFDPDAACYANGEILAFDNARTAGFDLPDVCPVKSALVARIRYQGKCWAVLVLLHVVSPYTFIPADLENAELAVCLITMLLERATLIEEKRQTAMKSHWVRTQFSFLRDVIENLPVMFFTKDVENGTYRLCNQLFARFAGKQTIAEVSGLRADDLFKPEMAARFNAQDAQVIANGGRIEFSDFDGTADAPTYSFKTIKIVIRSMTGRSCILGLSIDLSRERALMRQLEQERDRAVAAEKAKSQFFSAISHDIRTPLNAILGFSELLDLGVDDPADRRQYLAAIHSCGNMLISLVNDVLDFSKLEIGKMDLRPEPTDISTLVREVVASFGVMAGKKDLALEVRVAEMPRFNLDPQRVRQILFNLIGNAVKFTASGSITVCAAYDAEKGLTLAVRDTGCGIAPADQARIFEPFVQFRASTDDGQRGTGLGLTISSSLAARMKGTLTLQSEVGKGSTFTLTLPQVETLGSSEQQDRATGSAALAAHDVSRLRVLVVDDTKFSRIVAAAMLRRLGVAQVVMAESGPRALELLRTQGPFDEVLTDLWMPEMSGADLLRAIRTDPALARQRVTVLTADVEALKTTSEYGFSNFLLKPISMETLKAELEAVDASR